MSIRITVLLLILSFCFSSLFSQDWQYYDSLRTKYLERESYDSALICTEKLVVVIKDRFGENDTMYAKALSFAMEVNYYLEKYDKAIGWGEKELAVRKVVNGEDHIDFAGTCAWLGYLYYTTGNYKKAEEMYLKTLEIRKVVLGEISDEYARGFNNLALLYADMGRYREAKPIYLRTAEIYKQLYGEKHKTYARAISNLAALYDDLGEYGKAEPLYIEATNIRKEVLGEKDPEYATSLNVLAALYDVQGNYPLAEQLYTKAKNIRKEVLGEKSSSYAVSLNNLAMLYKEVGNYAAAEPLYLEAGRVWKEALGEKHPNYAYSLDNLASLYRNMGKYEKAEPLYLEALKIRKESLGEKHPRYALTLSNIGLFYFYTGDYTVSEKYLLEAMGIYKEILGENHTSYGLVLNNLAKLYSATGKKQEALKLMERSVQIFMNNFGEVHHDYAVTILEMAREYFKADSLEKARDCFSKGIFSINNVIQKNFSFLSEKEKEMYFTQYSYAYENFFSYALTDKVNDPGITRQVYDIIIKNKGVLLKSSSAMRNSIISSNDTTLLAMYEKWTDLKKDISKLYATEVKNRNEDPAVLEEQANAIEKELVRKSQAFGEYEKTMDLNWEDIKSSLNPGEAAVEFIRFKSIDDDKKIIYCALVVTPACTSPEMIRLFEEKEMLKITEQNSGNSYKLVNSIYGTNSGIIESLYKLVWSPLEPILKGVKTVYYSPDGILHKISFSAIGTKDGIRMCDMYDLQRVSSTGILGSGRLSGINFSNIKAGLFGGIDYYNDSSSANAWPYLPGTRAETENIARLMKKNKITATYYSGVDATEEAIKAAAPECRVLHISTHGFFYPSPDDAKVKAKEETEDTKVNFRGSGGFGQWQFVNNRNPLMRSGLVMAGANKVWTDPYPGTDNEGVLTAYEVSNMNIRNTDLVVLSACETGLGEIRGSEGVYGLQRAFKMAGVKYIIMSLWQVPDKETVEFMEMFYKKLLKEKNVRRAFNETQKEMRGKYDPYFWAAFVLIE